MKNKPKNKNKFNIINNEQEEKEFRKSTESWSSQDWEDYLLKFEGSQTELLLNEPLGVENVEANNYNEKVYRAVDQLNFPVFKDFLFQIINKLEPRQQEVIHYSYWSELTVSEIAEKLNVSRQAVYRVQARALKQISKVLVRILADQSVETDKASTKEATKCLSV